jgi:hypothetical protein
MAGWHRSVVGGLQPATRKREARSQNEDLPLGIVVLTAEAQAMIDGVYYPAATAKKVWGAAAGIAASRARFRSDS